MFFQKYCFEQKHYQHKHFKSENTRVGLELEAGRGSRAQKDNFPIQFFKFQSNFPKQISKSQYEDGYREIRSEGGSDFHHVPVRL